MVNNGTVSLLMPCYNISQWLGRMLESICNQTYRPIQLVMVDDGSTDNLKQVIEDWHSRLKEAGIDWILVQQSNGGIGAAINAGLEYCTGDYISFPDPDDMLTNDSIEKKVCFLRDHPQYAVVTSDAYIVSEDDLDKKLGKISGNNPQRWKENQFELLLHENSIFCPICHLIRADAFWETHPKRKIYPSRYGQNWQILLPLYYRYPRGFLDEPLCYYTVRRGSLSRGDDSLKKHVDRQMAHLDIVLHTLQEMDMPAEEKSRYMRESEIHFARKILATARRFGDKKLLKEQKIKLKKYGEWGVTDTFQFIIGSNLILRQLYQSLSSPIKTVIRLRKNKI